MHRDKKIGFALGILLLGIVAAFFFRNEPDPFAELPPLDDPAALDGQIAEKPIAPYTEEPDAPIRKAPNETAGNQWELPEIYRPAESRTSQAATPPVSPGAPAPIDLADPVPEPADPPETTVEVGSPFESSPPASPPDAELPGNDAWTAIPEKPASPNPATAASPPAVKGTPQNQAASLADGPTRNSPGSLYKIKKGDTLSVLAETHLGSSRRYMEIYEANRDKLRNPNDIQVGMMIRIPPRVDFEKKSGTPAAGNANPPPPPETLAPPPEEASRFRPFSRSPLRPTRQ